MKALSLQEVLQFVNGEIMGGINPAELNTMVIDDVVVDSRKAKSTSLFVPIHGERFDAHDFIPQVLEAGCKVVLSHKNVNVQGAVCIKVEDTRKALGDLAAGYLAKLAPKVIGVTGSVGKTTCKDLIASCLSGKYNVLKTDGNFNNDIGLPLTVFRLEEEHDIAVLEMGMNHAMEIDYLSAIAKPEVMVITNIGVSHIENLGSRQGICNAKCEIMNHSKMGSTIFINKDDEFHRQIEDYAKTRSINTVDYGIRDEDVDYHAKCIDMSFICHDNQVEPSITGIISHNNIEQSYRLPSLGKHLFYNLLPAVAIGEHFGLTTDEILKGLASYIPTGRRLNAYKIGKNIIIDDVYNASPDSMKGALSTLKDLHVEGRKVAFLGDMLEMGEHGPSHHEEVGRFASTCDLDFCVFIGKDSRHMAKGYEGDGRQYRYFESTEDCVKHMSELIQSDDTLLFKASRGMHFEKLIDEIDEVTR